MDWGPDADRAAAIAAAIQKFRIETAIPPGGGQSQAVGPWQRAALLEGVGKQVTIEDLEGKGGARWPS
jgi:hypothetical protein